MEEIKNPLKQKIALTYIGVALGIGFILAPMVVASFKLYQFYFSYVGVVIIIFAIGFFIFFTKRSRQFLELMEKREESLVWQHDEDKYLGFVGVLSDLQRKSNIKTILVFMAIITITSIALFMGLDEGIKYYSFIFFAILTVTSILFTIVFPESFKYRANVKPYVTIINNDSAYIMGRFHKWTKARAVIKNHDNGSQIYKVLAINYETFTRNGKMFQEWTAMIPEPKNKEMMAQAKRWVGRINKCSRDREEERKLKKTWSEKLFDKMMGKKA